MRLLPSLLVLVNNNRPYLGTSARRIMTEAAATNASSPTSSAASPRRGVVVFGGNGYVGQAVCMAALRLGLGEVTSVSRRGKPRRDELHHLPLPLSFMNAGEAATETPDWVDKVRWLEGDARTDLDPSTSSNRERADAIRAALRNAAGVVTCLGAITGSEQSMRETNGLFNVQVARASLEEGVPRFVYVSSAPSTMPRALLRGYYEGKAIAEAGVKQLYGNTPTTSTTTSATTTTTTGFILRPGLIYGNRAVGRNVTIPIGLLGSPLRWLVDTTHLSALRSYPMCSAPLTPPVAVADVGMAAASAALVDAITSSSASSGNGGGEGSQRVILASLLDDAAAQHHQSSDVIAYPLDTATPLGMPATQVPAPASIGGGKAKVFVLEYEGIETVAALGREIAAKRVV